MDQGVSALSHRLMNPTDAKRGHGASANHTVR